MHMSFQNAQNIRDLRNSKMMMIDIHLTPKILGLHEIISFERNHVEREMHILQDFCTRNHSYKKMEMCA